MDRFCLYFFISILAVFMATPAYSDEVRGAHRAVMLGNYSKALEILTAEKQKKNPKALYLLGLLYDSGKGVPRSIDKAKDYYLSSAKLGYALGQLFIGVFYEEGISVEKDLVKARDWYLLAAEQDEKQAILRLGFIYLEDETKDTDRAIYWLRKAAYNKSTRAMGMLATLLFSKDERIEAYAWSHLAAKYDPIQSATSARRVIESYCSDTEVEEGIELMNSIESEWDKI